MALALSAQPWSVVAAILLVSSRRGVAKEIAYVIGWMSALVVVAGLAVALYPEVPQSSTTSTVLSWVEIGLGVALVAWVLSRRGRPRTAEPTEPAWMGRLDQAPPLLAFVLGAFLPNYVIVVAAVDQMLHNDLRSGRLLAAVVAFVLVASIGVAAPLWVLVFRRDRAAEVYEQWRHWLIAHSAVAGLAVLGLVGAFLLIKGVVGLLA
jgi:hypothetical protein